MIQPCKPMKVAYLDNKMLVSPQVKEKLQFFKLSATTNTINMFSTCCSTLLALRGAVHDKAVAVPVDYCCALTTNMKIDDRDSLMVFCKNEWPEDLEFTNPPKVPSLWIQNGLPTGSEGWECVLQEFTEKLGLPIDEHPAGESFEDILRAKGGNVKIMN